jgi:hypothetical protein
MARFGGDGSSVIDPDPSAASACFRVAQRVEDRDVVGRHRLTGETPTGAPLTPAGRNQQVADKTPESAERLNRRENVASCHWTNIEQLL